MLGIGQIKMLSSFNDCLKIKVFGFQLESIFSISSNNLIEHFQQL